MRTLLGLTLVGLLLFGCDDPEPSAAQPEPTAESPEPPSEPEPEPTAETETARESAAPRAPTPLTPAQRERKRQLLREGRRLVREGDVAEAFTRFEALVELAPRSPSVLCEAGYVAHRARREEAQSLLQRGMVAFGAYPTIEGERLLTLARCEYNLGLVAQAHQRPYQAVRYYRASLQHRDNDTVRSRLAELEADIAEREDLLVAEDLDDVIDVVLEPSDEEEDSSCEWTGDVLAQHDAAGERVGFVEATGVDCYMGGGGVLYFALGEVGELYSFLLDDFEEDDYDAAARNSSSWGDFEFRRFSAGGHDYWRVAYTTTENHHVEEEFEPPSDVPEDEDAYCNYLGGTTRIREELLVCSVEETRCVSFVTARRAEGAGYDFSCDGFDDAHVPAWALDAAGFERGEALHQDDGPPQIEYGLEATFEEDRVRLRSTAGERPDWVPDDGEMTIEALLQTRSLNLAPMSN